MEEIRMIRGLDNRTLIERGSRLPNITYETDRNVRHSSTTRRRCVSSLLRNAHVLTCEECTLTRGIFTLLSGVR